MICPHCSKEIDLDMASGFTSWVCPECRGYIPGNPKKEETEQHD